MSATPTDRPSRSRRELRALALFVTFAYGCATVRVPASAIGPVVPVHDGAAEPQVELWLESGQDVTPAEADRATVEARAALERALASRRVTEGEQLLVVRAQGVSRTPSRKADQQAAVAGMVVGAVVIVAAVVVAIVAGKGGGGKGGGKVGGAKIRPAPAPVASVPRPAPRPVAVPRPVRPAPVASRPHRSPVHLGVHADVHVPYPVPRDDTFASGVYLGRVHEPEASGGAPAELALPPPPPLDVDRRGFFAKDLLRLELTLVDRATGAPLWVKTVEGEIDPRSAEAVKALLDGALDDPRGWLPASTPRA